MDTETRRNRRGPQNGGANSRTNQVYRKLCADLMAGVFAPQGRLTEEQLAGRYGVSRTPVREAIARLIKDGVLVKRDGGLYPHVPSFPELADDYELRLTLERQGINRVLAGTAAGYDQRLLRKELARWQKFADKPPQPGPQFVAEDEAFHRTLLAAAGNPQLALALDQVAARIRPVRMYDYLTPDRMTATITEHLALLHLVLSGELATALQVLETHVGASRDVVVHRAVLALSAAAPQWAVLHPQALPAPVAVAPMAVAHGPAAPVVEVPGAETLEEK